MPGASPRIVVGVDGSSASERALDWAVAETRRTDGSLHLVSAWVFPMALGYAFTTTVRDVRQAAEELLDHSTAHAREAAPGIKVSGETTEQLPGPALVAAARDADILVVGSRGLGGFEGLLIGSVSRYCSRHAACSVVVVR